MSQNGQFIIIAVLGYLAGSIPFGAIVSKYHGVDIRKKGSGNIGFANIRRHLGWKAGLIVLTADLLKGYVPVALAVHMLSVNQTIITATLVLLGSVFSVLSRFKGGKGVAALVGISFAASPLSGLIAAFIYMTCTWVVRKSAPGSLAAVWSLPITAVFWAKHYVWFYVAAVFFITWTHRSNIKTLRKSANGPV
jgi:glycerol-3-phosphate acyltransferase PlsY